MVIYEKEKNELVLQGKVTLKEILKKLPYDFYDMDNNSLVIRSNIVVNENAVLFMDEVKVIIDCSYIVFNKNSSLVIGSDNTFEVVLSKVYFNVDIIKSNNIGDVYITFKNCIAFSNRDFNISNCVVSVINSSVNFNINTDKDFVVKNVILKNNAMIGSSYKNVVYHDISTLNKLPIDIFLSNKKNSNVIFYRGVIDNYQTLLENNVKDANVFFKGTELKNGYEIIENTNVNLYHEFHISGTLYNNMGELLPMVEYNILDKDGIIVAVLNTDEYGKYSIWVPYYTYSNNKPKYHMPLKIEIDSKKYKSFSVNENKENFTIILSNNIDKDLLLLIERVSNNIDNQLEEVKNGVANLLYNSENPIKNISPVTVKAVDGTKLTINN